MSQSRTMSAVEAAAGTAVGFLVSWALTPLILALFGYQAGAGVAFGIVCIYTALSFARSWAVRRFFNWLHVRRGPANDNWPPEVPYRSVLEDLPPEIAAGIRAGMDEDGRSGGVAVELERLDAARKREGTA